MRFDHIVVHVDPDNTQLQILRSSLMNIGYPFEPDNGKGNNEFKASNINIGNEYIEVVRLFKPNAQSWVPLWTHHYDMGLRGAYCIFLEVPDVERSGVSLKLKGIRARGPANLSYPTMFGLMRSEAPYTIYYLPNFADSQLQLGLMQFKVGKRESTQANLYPNASQNGINGVRRVEVELPNLEESMDLLQKLFEDLHLDGSAWTAQLDKQSISFSQSASGETRVRLVATTSQRASAGKSFSIGNLEVKTIGG
jgi:hypothetical protein